MRSRLSFTWDLLYHCNYRCSYCWWDPHWLKFAEKYAGYPSARQWIRAWENVRRLSGEADISVLGGEPLMYAGFSDMVRALTTAQGHHVCITTNLYTGSRQLADFVKGISPEKLDLSCSYHPHFASLTEVLEKVKALKELGFHVPVYLISFPPFLEELPSYEETVRRAGGDFRLRIFCGEYNGKTYPRDYTDPERALLSKMLGNPVQVDYQIDQKTTLGERCYSGAVYGNVKPTGDVYRCGQSAIDGKPMGNIFDEDFHMLPGPTPCPFTHCSCQEYEYVAKEYERKRALRAGMSVA
ncbi:MAG TPA: radical SAM protein [Elusimicrobiota bacterium]|nr:radical SAM protein [Elusimicrobiota bacterium]